MQIQPYLSFEGRCEEAIEFYKRAVGAEVKVLMRFQDAPEGACAGGNPQHVMHAALQIGQTELLMTDGMASGKPEFKGISLSMTVDGDAEAQKRFAALAEDGEIRFPLHSTFFATSFGMLTDRFGVAWTVVAPVPVRV